MHHGEYNRFIPWNKHPKITIGENNECSRCYIGYINHALIADRQTTLSPLRGFRAYSETDEPLDESEWRDRQGIASVSA